MLIKLKFPTISADGLLSISIYLNKPHALSLTSGITHLTVALSMSNTRPQKPFVEVVSEQSVQAVLALVQVHLEAMEVVADEVAQSEEVDEVVRLLVLDDPRDAIGTTMPCVTLLPNRAMTVRDETLRLTLAVEVVTEQDEEVDMVVLEVVVIRDLIASRVRRGLRKIPVSGPSPVQLWLVRSVPVKVLCRVREGKLLLIEVVKLVLRVRAGCVLQDISILGAQTTQHELSAQGKRGALWVPFLYSSPLTVSLPYHCRTG